MHRLKGERLLERFAVVREGLGGASFEDGLDAAPGKGLYDPPPGRNFAAGASPADALCALTFKRDNVQTSKRKTWRFAEMSSNICMA